MKQPQSNSQPAIMPQWYVWYTKPRAEKKVFERLISKGIDTFLPLRRELRQWSDRKKWVDVALFPGYIFTNIAWHEAEKIEFTEGILTYVRYNGRPAVLRSEELERIMLILANTTELEVQDVVFSAGEAVEITEGPLRGLIAEVISLRGQKKLGVTIESLGKTMLVELPKAFVRKQLKRA